MNAYLQMGCFSSYWFVFLAKRKTEKQRSVYQHLAQLIVTRLGLSLLSISSCKRDHNSYRVQFVPLCLQCCTVPSAQGTLLEMAARIGSRNCFVFCLKADNDAVHTLQFLQSKGLCWQLVVSTSLWKRRQPSTALLCALCARAGSAQSELHSRTSQTAVNVPATQLLFVWSEQARRCCSLRV